jgi:hypothetical protein
MQSRARRRPERDRKAYLKPAFGLHVYASVLQKAGRKREASVAEARSKAITADHPEIRQARATVDVRDLQSTADFRPR